MNQNPSALRHPRVRESASSPSGASGRSVVRRFPVTVFVTLTLSVWFAVSTLIALAAYDRIPGGDALRAVHDDLEQLASFLLVLIVLGSAVTVTARVDGRAGVRRLLSRALLWRVHPVWWFVAGLALPATTVALAVILGDEARVPSASVLGSEVAATVVGLLLINLWEETGWTGTMQLRLMERHSLFVAAALTSVPFSLVHMPLRVITGEASTPGEVLAQFVILTAFLLLFRTLLGSVARGSGSVLLVAVTHTLFNRSNNGDGIASDVLSGDQHASAALLATVLVAAVVVTGEAAVRRRGRRTSSGD